MGRMANLTRAATGIGGRLRAVPLARRIILLTAILLAAVYASSALILTRYYAALGERERDSRDARAQLLAEHAGRALVAIDLALETIAETLKPRLPLTRPTMATQRLLDKYVKSLPQVRALAVIDADGVTLNNSRAFPPPKLNASSRSFFTAQKKSGGAGLYLGRIATSRIDRQSFFAMSRPLLDHNGNFQGVVAAITDPRYFAHFYTPQAEQATEAVLLERDDGAVLASAGVPYDALTALERHPVSARPRGRVAVGEVRGFPARIVLIGKPIIALSQFTILVATDMGLLIVMTAMGVYLAATAAREAAGVDREAQARRTAEARLLSAIEGAPAGFALYDRNGRSVLANDLYRSFRTAIEETAEPGREASPAPERRAPAPRQRRWRGDPTESGEPVFQLPDGRWLMARQRRTKEGDTVVFYSDITSLKQLDRLTGVQRLFVDALEHIPSGLMLCDAEDRIVFCNSATRQYFPNVTELLVPGTPFETLVRAQVASLYLPAATADPEGWIAERMAQHRAGTTYAVRAYADGRWAQIIERRTANGCTIGIRTDITEIKLKEEALRQSEEAERAARRAAEQADQAKNTFLANMSHELRTPLNAIIGFSEMIALAMRGPLPETYRHYGELVCSSGLHLLSIISDMLDIAKLNSGKAELRLEPIDVAAIIDEAVSMMSEKAAGAGVRITTDLAAQCPRIEADPLRLRQVLLNLLGNAVKFTPSGGHVEIATAVLAHVLRITVADTGIGMTSEDIPRALEPFTQVGNNAQRGREGTGLGLPISKTLIELHGGRFEIASVPERGTTVTIDLPLHRPDEPTAPVWELDVAV
jgi:signal transduction histidine kinase